MKVRQVLTTLCKIAFTLQALNFTIGCTPKISDQKNITSTSISNSISQEKGTWTCPMHPHVHKDGPGKCPICGMPLILVDRKSPSTIESSGVETSEVQIRNANITKHVVTKKDFTVTLSVSGRLVSSREIAFQVYESDLPLIKVGLAITGFTSNNPSLLIRGKIARLDNLVDPSSRTVRVTAILDSPITGFIAETSFHGKIQQTLKQQIIIPEDAVLHTGISDLVYIFVENSTLDPKQVILGQKSNFEYQVLSGLKEGDIISGGANFLIDSEAKIRGH